MRAVVCIDDSECFGVTKGRTYKVRSEWTGPGGASFVSLAGVLGVYLAERFEDAQ